ncbi:hypothetical protein N7478_011933 [Penicillium angulare]|uniref:uncharacterized protein n=1 Tax=Penicillium angulare TaxID=116970 RepID=UPI002542164A|nr:uncharacterized protein N7478_011933 [Penicillium angulare]KAJ5261338.1 hypothetical protein N7478_011933 [Penicillium angulare]
MPPSSTISEVEAILNEKLWPFAQAIDTRNIERVYLNAQKQERSLTTAERMKLVDHERSLPSQQLAFLHQRDIFVMRFNLLTDRDKSRMNRLWGSKLQQCDVRIPGFRLVNNHSTHRFLLFSNDFLSIIKFIDTRLPPLASILRGLENELLHLPIHAGTRGRRDHLESQITDLQRQRVHLREEARRRFDNLTAGEKEVLCGARQERLAAYGLTFQSFDPA